MPSSPDPALWLALSGGNALGAYQAGVLERLSATGRLPSRIAGGSIGAINGALFAGNAPERRMERLKEFWHLASQHGNPILPWWSALSRSRRGERPEKRAAAMETLAFGRPGLFHPRLTALWSLLPGTADSRSLFDPAPLRRTLASLIDFGRLNAGEMRLLVAAVNAQTGEDAVFDSHAGGITADHLIATTAIPAAFPPGEVDGRSYFDPGLSANLPLAALFAERPEEPVFCLAADLVSPAGRVPHSVGEALGRMLDLVFASQSRHAIRELELRFGSGKEKADIALVHLVYHSHGMETAAKTVDYSTLSLNERWNAGRADGDAALALFNQPPSGLSVRRVPELFPA